jgi:hypothetical protein
VPEATDLGNLWSHPWPIWAWGELVRGVEPPYPQNLMKGASIPLPGAADGGVQSAASAGQPRASPDGQRGREAGTSFLPPTRRFPSLALLFTDAP